MHTLAAIRALLGDTPGHRLSLEVYLDPAEPTLAHTSPECSALELCVPARSLDCTLPHSLRMCEECEELIEEAVLTENTLAWTQGSTSVLCEILDLQRSLGELAREVRAFILAELSTHALQGGALERAGDLAAALARTRGEITDLERAVSIHGQGSALLSACTEVLTSAAADAGAALRENLRSHQHQLLHELRRRVSIERGATELIELEEDEVLIGYVPEVDRNPEGLASLLTLTFAIGGRAHAPVLCAPRFLASLLATSTLSWVETAPAPAGPGACEIAAALWDPGAHTGLTSLVAAARTAQETLTLAS